MKIILLILLSIIVAALQLTALPWLAIFGVVPDLVLAIIVVWAIYQTSQPFSWLVLLPAVWLDFLVGQPFGFLILSYWLTFLLIHWLARTFFKQSGWLALVVLSILGILFFHLALPGLIKLADILGVANQLISLGQFYRYPNLAVVVVYNGLLCGLLVWPIRKIQRYLEQPRKSLGLVK